MAQQLPPRVRFEEVPTPSFAPQTVRVRVSQSDDLGETMKSIRTWLDRQTIHPASFRTTADPRGYLLTIEFANGENAERFRQQFHEAASA
jgi:hypothetical protein